MCEVYVARTLNVECETRTPEVAATVAQYFALGVREILARYNRDSKIAAEQACTIFTEYSDVTGTVTAKKKRK